MNNELPRKTLNSLRVGDTVRIHLDHYGSDPRGVPFEAVLTSIEYDSNFDHNGNGRPIICWEPRPELDFYKSHDGKNVPSAFCDSSFVVEIVDRARYRTPLIARNSLCRNFHEGSYLDDAPRSPKCIAAQPAGLAIWLLSKNSNLDIPYGLSMKKLASEWVDSGRPGLKGTYRYATSSVEPGLGISDSNMAKRFFEISLPWIHITQFNEWLVRRLPHLIRTKSEFRQDMAQSVRDEEESYVRDMAYEYRHSDDPWEQLDEPVYDNDLVNNY